MPAAEVATFPILSQKDFKDAGLAFAERAQKLEDHSSWSEVVQCTKDDEFALRIRKYVSRPSRETTLVESGEIELEENLEEVDHEIFNREPIPKSLIVDFWITLSPTYQCPVLWFNFSNLSPEDPQGFDAIYEYLVPENHRSELKAVGSIGGISMAINPITDLPAFFIHPCNTPSALLELGQGNDISPLEYLFLWLGLVGPSVGLHVSSNMIT